MKKRIFISLLIVSVLYVSCFEDADDNLQPASTIDRLISSKDSSSPDYTATPCVFTAASGATAASWYELFALT